MEVTKKHKTNKEIKRAHTHTHTHRQFMSFESPQNKMRMLQTTGQSRVKKLKQIDLTQPHPH